MRRSSLFLFTPFSSILISVLLTSVVAVMASDLSASGNVFILTDPRYDDLEFEDESDLYREETEDNEESEDNDLNSDSFYEFETEL